MEKDLKPLFIWCKKYGDANIYDRVIMKALPTLVKHDIKLTSTSIDEQTSILVNPEIYDCIKNITEELLAQKFIQEN